MRVVAIFAVIVAVIVACNAGGDEEPTQSGPTGKYTEDECLLLKWKALENSQSQAVIDAAVQHKLHCQP